MQINLRSMHWFERVDSDESVLILEFSADAFRQPVPKLRIGQVPIQVEMPQVVGWLVNHERDTAGVLVKPGTEISFDIFFAIAQA